MKYLFGFIIFLNYLLYVVVAWIAWFNGEVWGICFSPPLIVFPIAIKIAHHFATSVADRFMLSEWDYFVKKLKWGNNAALVSIFIPAFLARHGGYL